MPKPLPSPVTHGATVFGLYDLCTRTLQGLPRLFLYSGLVAGELLDEILNLPPLLLEPRPALLTGLRPLRSAACGGLEGDPAHAIESDLRTLVCLICIYRLSIPCGSY